MEFSGELRLVRRFFALSASFVLHDVFNGGNRSERNVAIEITFIIGFLLKCLSRILRSIFYQYLMFKGSFNLLGSIYN